MSRDWTEVRKGVGRVELALESVCERCSGERCDYLEDRVVVLGREVGRLYAAVKAIVAEGVSEYDRSA
jgi:hypothetical protein